MVAEERITTKFSGLVAAGNRGRGHLPGHPTGRRGAAHAVLRALQDEVIASPDEISAHVRRAREQVSNAFRQIFDVALVEAHDQLLAQPEDLTAKVRFITLYHQVLEGTLGLTSFQVHHRPPQREELLPGFVEGYTKIHHDETRHIGYGVWFLREAARATPQSPT